MEIDTNKDVSGGEQPGRGNVAGRAYRRVTVMYEWQCIPSLVTLLHLHRYLQDHERIAHPPICSLAPHL